VVVHRVLRHVSATLNDGRWLHLIRSQAADLQAADGERGQ
jgi:hypothetical protein